MSFVTVPRHGASNFIQSVLAQDVATIAAQDAEIARRVRQEVARLREKAEAEGRALGEAAARAAAAPGLESLTRAANILTATCAQLAAPLAAHEAEIAGLVTELAFLLARHIAAAPQAAGSAEAGAEPTALIALVT
ncbi:MAG: hypothetical protein POH28_14185, partial [Acidocella sp.]|nr:hypothetical protein [Acidocella sp.]